MIDVGEVIALDIPFDVFAAHATAYTEAFTLAWAQLLGIDMYDIYFEKFIPSSSGTVNMYFDVSMPPMGTDTSSAVIVDSHQHIASFFASSDPSADPLNPPPNTTATAAAVSVMQSFGLPITAAYYIDQRASSYDLAAFTPVADPGPGELNPWNMVDAGIVVALDIPFSQFGMHSRQYSEAFLAAVSESLMLNISAAPRVVVRNFQPSSVGTTAVYFDVLLSGNPDTSSSAVLVADNLRVQDMFTHLPGQNPVMGAPLTSGAAGVRLLEALKRYGLPLTMAYFIDQLAFPSPPPPSPLPPPAPPPPIADWTAVDVGESIALDVPFDFFSLHNLYFETAFSTALADVLAIDEFDIYISDVQNSSVGTTVLYFDIAISPTFASSDAAEAGSAANVGSLFTSRAPGSPTAAPLFVSKLNAYGLPAGQAYYIDQYVATGATSSAPPVSEYATTVDEGEAVAVDIPYAAFMAGGTPYKLAFSKGMGTALGRPWWDVVDVSATRSAWNTTIVLFQVLLHGNSSWTVDAVDAAVVASHRAVEGLFVPDFATGEVETGSPAYLELTEALAEQGLPLSAAFYVDQVS